MERIRSSSFCNFRLLGLLFLIALPVRPARTQQQHIPLQGLVTDWTSQRVIFSNPGTEEEALAKGKLDEWNRIVTEPRYQMQQFRRPAWNVAGMAGAPSNVDSANGSSPGPSAEDAQEPANPRMKIRRDWSVQLGGGSGNATAIDMYAAKYSFSPIGSPDCVKDLVVFPVSGLGATNQANIFGVNNIYNTTCTGTVPRVLFTYFVGTGAVKTSAVLSLDGSKVAFVESVTNGSILHILTIDKSGNAGCPNSTPCNGTGFNTPAVPGTHNSAVDRKITLTGGVSVTRSSPFVNYSGDIAYVGDDTGRLHKITGVFKGSPAEAGSPWPVTLATGVILGGPVVDSGASKNIFVGGSNGNLYCVTAAGVACSTASISVASGTTPGAVLDVPIVDSTQQTVFAAASNSSNSILMQATTSLGSPIRATMGAPGTDLYDGAFDNSYFTSVSTGHMYFCGNLTTGATPTLWRVTFNSSGRMSSTNDGNSFQLVTTGGSGPGNDCTPLTEVFNTSQGKDFLFLGVKDHGFSTGTINCANRTCVMSFVLGASTFSTAANATFTANLGTLGMSGIIVDNVSGAAGASQIYFSNLQLNSGVQASQSTLQ